MKPPLKVCMVSTYENPVSGVCSYTENLIRSVEKHGAKIVQVEAGYGGLNELFYPFRVLAGTARAKPDIVHVQHEFFLYGGFLSALFFPVMLAMLKLLRKPLVVTVHGVIPPLSLIHI